MSSVDRAVEARAAADRIVRARASRQLADNQGRPTGPGAKFVYDASGRLERVEPAADAAGES